MVRGVDKETPDGLPVKWFEDASRLLRYEAYKLRPARRVYIPKANGKSRPLGISSPRDKIVQQALRIVLEIVLEPKFMETSHGFRPKRGCHSALKSIRSWQGVSWFVEGDIKSFFDSINHFILAELLAKHFDEARLIHLYWKLVKAGYVEFEPKKKPKFYQTLMGVPQGGIISPLLSNLVLHELDKFIKKLQLENSKKKTKGWNPTMATLSMPDWTGESIHWTKEENQSSLNLHTETAKNY